MHTSIRRIAEKELGIMTSSSMREDPLFMRNTFDCRGRWGIPLVHRQKIDTDAISLIACSDTRRNDHSENCRKGVHFFVDDYRFKDIYVHPQRTLDKYAQYAFLLTPDFSTYADMPIWRQIESVAQNRWIGAFWQSKGLQVIPTISWSTPRSFDFCFDGVETKSIVAVSTLGCRKASVHFLRGYDAMRERLTPDAIICFGTPISGMRGNIIDVNYIESRKVVR